MEQNMFCFQCEQTAGCTGCTGAKGVCGKTADTARLQDELTGALIGLSHAADENTPLAETTWKLMVEGLFATLTNVSFDDKAIAEITDRIHQEKARLRPDCGGCASPCGHNDDYDMKLLWNAQEDIRSLKSLILFGIRGMAAYAYHAMTLGYTDTEVNEFFAKALFALGEDWDMDLLLPIVMETGKYNLSCMELLDRANTATYGTPAPVTVPLTVEKGPFIVITGHDLHDLKLLLEQTEGKGINIYTHGEMLPCHAYPELKKYSHLKGNFGTHGTILGVADQVIDAVKAGAIRHFFLVAGCDGARSGRNYYTDFVKQSPSDSVILTLACGKYRFNDLDLGTIGGLPRLMDMGQCNDAYGAIKVAGALAEAFGCGVNELPLSMVLSWYEQKAVSILLTLLHLGIKNIRLGPTLPAFLSQNVLNYLVENFGIAAITTPEEDLKTLLG